MSKSFSDVQVRAFDKPVVERLQKRSTRFAIVLWFGMASAATIAAALLAPSQGWLWGGLFLLLFPAAMMLNMAVRGITEIPINRLDERFAQLRARSYHDAYRIGVAIAFLGGMGLMFLLVQPGSNWSLAAIGGVIGGLLMGLPAIILALRLPDELPHDDSDVD